MLENYYVYKKEIDWSLLHQGFSIPLDIQVVFQNNINKFIHRGQTKDIYLMLDGVSYKVKLVNQKFDEAKYPTHKDILQIRYNQNSAVASKLRNVFSSTYNYIYDQRNNMEQNQRRYFKIPEDKKEFLTVYTTEYEDTYLVDCITLTEVEEARNILLKENEQSYEASINYPTFDSTASLVTVQQLTKIRKLNRAIGDNLKMLYNYRCQICGDDFGQRFDTHIVESHHIDPFVVSMNNDASNQIIICPNHHRVIHKANPAFYKNQLMLVFDNGVEERLLFNKHL